MSALNFVNQGKRAFILQDAASYDEAGVVTSLRNKGAEIPGWGAFIASTGQSGAAEFFSEFLAARFDGIDDLFERGSLAFQEHTDFLFEDFSRYGEPRFACIVAGWSETRKRVLDAEFKLVHGQRRIVFRRDIQWTLSPAWGGPSQAREVALLDLGGTRSFDPHTTGLRIIEAQRRFETEPEELIPCAFLVGGHVTLTIVDRAGSSTSIIHTWAEDVVGERIRPTADFDPATAPNVSTMYSGSRALRRAAEKRAMKAAKLNQRRAS